MGEDLIENKIYVAKLFGSDLQGNDLYKLEPLKQIGNATFVKVAPEFKKGDFVYENGGIMIVKEYPYKPYAFIYPNIDMEVNYNGLYAGSIPLSRLSFRYATEDEKQLLIDALKKDGKRWNAEKLKIEDIPQPKFKIGDKVRIKKGVTTGAFMCDGLTLTVSGYDTQDQNILYCKGFSYLFHEDWLEPYVEELKKGDLAIFWDNDYLNPLIRLYNGKSHRENKYYDNIGCGWDNAIKWDGTKEQFEKIPRGEI